MIYLQLFWSFFKIGLLSVGGGLATLPFLYDLSDSFGWFSHAELADMIAVAESTPGPIGINMATFAGIRTAGLLGGVVATFGEVLPAFIIITIITSMLTRFSENRYVQSVMSTLRPLSVGLICAAMLSVWRVALLNEGAASLGAMINWTAFGVFAVLAVITFHFQKLHPIVVILLGAAAGILFSM